MKSELCKTCIHTSVCVHDKNVIGDVFVLGNPTIFDNEKLYEEYEGWKAAGFPCDNYTPEPKKGKWVKVPGYATPGGDPVWCCSECGRGEHVYGIEHGSYGAHISDDQWVACPNCGAIMKG